MSALFVKDKKRVLKLDTYEEGAVIEGLNKIRTEQLEKAECAEFVSDLMLKILKAPARKGRFRSEAR